MYGHGVKPPIHVRVKSHFDDVEMSFADIATRLDWHERKVVRLLTGKTDIKVDHLEVFAKLLKKAPAELLVIVDKSKRETRSAS